MSALADRRRSGGSLRETAPYQEINSRMTGWPLVRPYEACAQHGRGRLNAAETRFESATIMRSRRPALAAAARPPDSALKAVFFKIVLRPRDRVGCNGRGISLRQPCRPNIVTVAVAGFVSDRLFVGCLKIVDVQHIARSPAACKARQQAFSLPSWSGLR